MTSILLSTRSHAQSGADGFLHLENPSCCLFTFPSSPAHLFLLAELVLDGREPTRKLPRGFGGSFPCFSLLCLDECFYTIFQFTDLPLKYVKSVVYSLVPSIDFLFCFHHSNFYFEIPFYPLTIFLTPICCMVSFKESPRLYSPLSILSTLTSTSVWEVQTGPLSWRAALTSNTRPAAPSRAVPSGHVRLRLQDGAHSAACVWEWEAIWLFQPQERGIKCRGAHCGVYAAVSH